MLSLGTEATFLATFHNTPAETPRHPSGIRPLLRQAFILAIPRLTI